MLKVAKKYNLAFMAIRLSTHLKTQLPAWYHTCAEHCPMRGPAAVCLIETHQARTVAALLSISNRVQNVAHPYLHIPSQWCLYCNCVCDRTKQCKNPHACATEALARIQSIYPVMNPMH